MAALFGPSNWPGRTGMRASLPTTDGSLPSHPSTASAAEPGALPARVRVQLVKSDSPDVAAVDQQKNNHNQQNEPKPAARIVSPASAVRPSWQKRKQKQNQKNNQRETHHHSSFGQGARSSLRFARARTHPGESGCASAESLSAAAGRIRG